VKELTTMLHIPPGFTEEQVMADIEKAVNGLVSSFSFGYYDENDLRQEGFIYACEVLPKFDPQNSKKCSLSNFLRIAIRRRFLNLRRDKLHRNSPPCLSCKFHSNDECSKFDDQAECSKWTGWNERNQSKRSLVEPGDASKLTQTAKSQSSPCNKLFREELLQYVSDNISLSFRADYCRFIEGAKLTKSKRDAVVAEIRSIIEEVVDVNEIETWCN
jgi:DNA-directed RNA polymerase specialized sigma24 family protein